MRWEAVPEAERVRSRWEALISQGRLPPAFLWVGKEGIGKTALAWAATRSLFCTCTPFPATPCSTCQKVERLCHPDLHLIGPAPASLPPEEANQHLSRALLSNPFLSLSEYQQTLKATTMSIGVETVRRLHNALLLTPAEKSWRVVWFWHAETLTRQAANALLKLIEEPPPQTLFFFLATRLEALPVTVRSRTCIWSISPLSDTTLLQYVDGTRSEKEARLLVGLAGGSLSRLRQLQEPAWQELLQTTRQWLHLCFSGRPTETLSALLETLQRHSLLSEALTLALSLVQQHPELSHLQRTYAEYRLLEAVDALAGHLQPPLVLARLTTDLLQNWTRPPLTWEFLLNT